MRLTFAGYLPLPATFVFGRFQQKAFQSLNEWDRCTTWCMVLAQAESDHENRNRRVPQV